MNTFKMKNMIAWIVVSLMVLAGFSSGFAAVRGLVLDEDTKKPLELVNIKILDTTSGTSTDTDGYFKLVNIPAKSFDIEITCIGYKDRIIEHIDPDKDVFLDIFLKPDVISMQGVQIDGDKFDPRYRTELSRTDMMTLKAREVYKTAGALDDISRAVQMQGSVVPGGDYTSFYAVRGGSPDQNIVMMDGILFPNPYRLRMIMGGGLSVFNPHTVSDVNLQVGHFSAEYGDFMSSVLGVESRSGRRDRFGFGGNINAINTNLYFEGPISHTNGSWLVTGRRSYFDLIADQIDDTQDTYPQTWDYTAKLVFPVNARNKFEIKSLSSHEEMYMNSEEYKNIEFKESADIDLFALTYKGLWTDKIYETIHVAYYDEAFNYNINKPTRWDSTDANYKSKIKNFMIKEDVSIELAENHWISRGFYYSIMESDMGYSDNVNEIAFSRRTMPPTIDYDRSHNQLAAYVDYSARWFDRLETRAGVRYDYSSLVEKGHTSPRISMLYRLSKNVSINGFWGLCYQYPNVMSIFNRDWPLALDKVEQELEAERAEHLVLGMKMNILDYFTAQVDGYVKAYDDLLLPMDFEQFIPENSGEGYSAGMEVSLQTRSRPTDRFSAMISYSLSESRYRIKEEYERWESKFRTFRWIPYNYDRLHSLTAIGNVKLTKKLSASATWRYGSGLPYFEIHQFRDVSGLHNSFVKEFDNIERLPAYMRLDIRVNYLFEWLGMDCSGYIDLTNVLNRKNIYDVLWYTDDDNVTYDGYQKSIFRRNIYMMPFVPSVGISFRY